MSGTTPRDSVASQAGGDVKEKKDRSREHTVTVFPGRGVRSLTVGQGGQQQQQHRVQSPRRHGGDCTGSLLHRLASPPLWP
ncbi:hypothetical protein E2C01_082238 [Portunus trituberculatus]|uniref:Uncharacterized protein n=1 Tax=Portunus trituberculatus TaxID=210409 RepID=A0A5B7J388_PORTR|nr:hypothetical protein [Portunus trituberculatus]